MVITRLYLLPGLVTFALIGTFLITYIIGVCLDHIRPFFPYISDTGTTPPESTIFGQFLNLGSVFIFLTMYVRYLQLNRTYLSDSSLPNYENVKRLNRFSIWLAIIISLGASFVANFQETVALIPHMIGAFSCYFVGTIYFTGQAVISYMVCPQLNTLRMARFRLFLAVLSIVLSCICGLFGIISYFMFTKSIKHMPKWGPDDGGYEIHIVSSLTEWATTIVFAAFFITFIKEFKNLVVICPKVELINQRNHPTTISTVDRTNKKIGEDNNNRNISETIPSSNPVQNV